MTEVQRLAKIKVLKDMLKEYGMLAKYNGGTDYDRWKALDMAIKALEQEPCEDCVSRQAVLNTLDTADKFLDEDRTVENYKVFLKECYKVLPPVTPTRKKEKWIGKENLQGLEHYYQCSNCGNHCLYEYVEIGFRNAKTKYCPYCGAEMESEE